MPEDYEKYFSFSQYAIELNELEEGLKDKLPQTDCRFRPDQRWASGAGTCVSEWVSEYGQLCTPFCVRLLEESFVQDAEVEKHRVEQVSQIKSMSF